MRPHPPLLLASISDALARPLQQLAALRGDAPRTEPAAAKTAASAKPTVSAGSSSGAFNFHQHRSAPSGETAPEEAPRSHSLPFGHERAQPRPQAAHTSATAATAAAPHGGKRSGVADAPAAAGCGPPPLGGLPGEIAKVASLVGSHLVIRLAQLQAAAVDMARPPHPSDHPHDGALRHLGQFVASWRRRLREKHEADRQHRLHHRRHHRLNRAAAVWVERGAAAERAMDLPEAVRCFEAAAEADPGSAEVLCRLSKQLSDMSFMPGASHAVAEQVRAKLGRGLLAAG